MITLGIESSCDETAIAVLENGRTVLSSIVSSQIQTHAKWGGVVPEIAAREHASALNSVFCEAVSQAKIQPTEIDLIAVTQGPGLVGCLLVGASFAKGLAQILKKPVVPVNHIHAHVHGALLGIDKGDAEIYPTLALVASGGHTNLYYMTSPVQFSLVAHTIDDACGESFDKVGKMLGLPYPGGPHIERLARQGDPTKCKLPRMLERKSQMAFSYSGLKTAVANQVKLNSKDISHADIAAAFQTEAVGQLIRKIKIALELNSNVKSIVISGGVAANQYFQSTIQASTKVPCYFPGIVYCSDNGAMIAAMGYQDFIHTNGLVTSLHDWDVFSRYAFEQYKS